MQWDENDLEEWLDRQETKWGGEDDEEECYDEEECSYFDCSE